MSPEVQARRVLGISAAAPLTRESIQSAYRKTVRAKHPDFHPGSRINMATLNAARDVLLREVERREREEALALATKIRAEHGAIKERMGHVLNHAVEAGQLLTQVKARLKHGDFTPFVRRHCQLPLRTAQHYMRLAEMWAKVRDRDKDARFARLTGRALSGMAGHERKKDVGGPDAHSQSHAEEQRTAPPTEQKTTKQQPPVEQKPPGSFLFGQTPPDEPPLDHDYVDGTQGIIDRIFKAMEELSPRDLTQNQIDAVRHLFRLLELTTSKRARGEKA